MTSKTDLKPSACRLPAELAEVALIDARTCAAAGDMSVSWWHEQVRAGRAPVPAIRKPRCTRWHMASVAAFWSDCAAKAAADSAGAERVKAHAHKASAAAQAKRATATTAAEQ